MTKTDVIQSFKDLPEEVSAEQLIERILFLKRIERAMEQVKNGQTIPHEQVMKEAKEWLKEQK